MYTYSPIKTIYIKNFRNIGEATIDFDESPIVCLIGENEAGKTSVVKAFAVAALHAYPRDQKDFIRDGTNGFGVCLELKDGSKITRIKTSTLNKYTVETPDGKVWDTNKIDSGLPMPVQKLMGLIEEPETKEYLQIRTYEDKLLFVVTPASTNYKVMYDALKVDQLTRAIKVGSREANDLKASINDTDASIRTLTDNLRTIRTFDLEPVINIKNRLLGQMKELDRIERANHIRETIAAHKNSLGAIGLIEEAGITEIDLVRVDKLVNANRLLNRLDSLGKLSNNYSKLDTLETIDTTLVNKIKNAMDKKEELHRKIEMAGAYRDLANLTEISEYRARALSNARALVSKVEKLEKLDKALDYTGARLVNQSDFDVVNKCLKVKQIVDRNKLLNSALVESEGIIKQISDYLKAIGAAVANCPNCGESVVMNVGVHSH